MGLQDDDPASTNNLGDDHRVWRARHGENLNGRVRHHEGVELPDYRSYASPWYCKDPVEVSHLKILGQGHPTINYGWF